MWIVVTAAIAVLAIAAAARRRAAIASDLGWVTERWLAEYRTSQVADSK
jgi:hypothetical protein